MNQRVSVLTLAIFVMALSVTPARASSAKARPAAESAGATVHLLLRKQLRDQPGTDVVMLTVGYPPGGVTAPHEHPGYTFAYVLSGGIVSGLGNQPARTYTAGQFFTEFPHEHHMVSRNASRTAAARMLVFMVVPHQTKQLTIPLSPRP